MATIKAEVTGIKTLLRKLKKLSPKQSQEILVKSLQDCAKLVQDNAANKQIIQQGRVAVTGPRGGTSIKQAPVHPTRLTSRRGGAGLVGSISINQSHLPASIDVGTKLKYGRVHELGLGRYPKRPFLKPGVEAVEDRFPAIFMKHWRRIARV